MYAWEPWFSRIRLGCGPDSRNGVGTGCWANEIGFWARGQRRARCNNEPAQEP
ncbi:hypothetical protein PILCRDRAFT_17050 [Piloderma croceum F 1598]|uniref:Uncharacterized protein n=1 Tax=Piloderma croceum (strain F 1598) TaxID=765440 RepID=A0A0C3ETP4_PILCF|nr:hypothetical protein PILCRDRAFT_17050 [Piloderma croceum F 1598]